MSSVYPPYGGMQSVPCQRCHAPLLPNEATCRNCGYYNAPAQGNTPAVQGASSANGSWGGGTLQPSYGQNQGQYGPPAWGQFSVSPASTLSSQEQNTFNNPPSAPVQPRSGNFFGAPSIPSSSMEGNGYASNQAAPPVLPGTPPSAMPQRSSGLLSSGQIGQQSPGSSGPASQAPYGVPPVAPQRSSGLLSSGQVGPQSGPISQAFYGVSSTGPVSQASYGTPSIGPVSQAPYGTPSTGPVSQSPYGVPPAGFQQFGAPTVAGQSFPGMGSFDASRAQSAGPQSFSGGMGAPSSSPDLPRFAQPASQETSSKRRMKPWMIVLVVLLVIVIVGGGFVGYTLFNKQSNATPTTAAGSATQGTSFTDTFKNNANGWSLPSDPGKFSISLANGSLVVEDDSNELLWEPLPGNKTFSDFTLSADAMLSQGDQTNGYGFYIRGSSVRNAEMASYYRFELYGDGSYAIFKGSLDANGNPTNTKLVNYTLSSAIQKQGIVNHITITAKGSSLSLMVNGQLVKTVTDTSYTTGSIAPFVSNMQNAKPGAQAKFSNLTIVAA